MATRSTPEQIVFRYQVTDSPSGVTRGTAKRTAKRLRMNEVQVIHHALRELAVRILPQYEPDDGLLNAAQLRQIRKRAAHGKGLSLHSSLIDRELARTFVGENSRKSG